MVEMLVFLVICGIAWYFLGDKIAEPFRTMALVVIILIFVIWLLSFFGYVNTPFPRYRFR